MNKHFQLGGLAILPFYPDHISSQILFFFCHCKNYRVILSLINCFCFGPVVTRSRHGIVGSNPTDIQVDLSFLIPQNVNTLVQIDTYGLECDYY